MFALCGRLEAQLPIQQGRHAAPEIDLILDKHHCTPSPAVAISASLHNPQHLTTRHLGSSGHFTKLGKFERIVIHRLKNPCPHLLPRGWRPILKQERAAGESTYP